jgi:phospholipid/cholesterol/gamma-HCH transport system permease protein
MELPPRRVIAVVISAVMILVLDAFWALVWLTGRTIR